jgi:hypothetical protein
VTSSARSASTAICGRCTSPRSEETENERLLREAGLLEYQQHPEQAPPPLDPKDGTYAAEPRGRAYLDPLERPKEWDVFTTAEAPDTVDLIVRNGEPDFFGLDPEGEFAVHAERLDGDFWELQVGVL